MIVLEAKYFDDDGNVQVLGHINITKATDYHFEIYEKETLMKKGRIQKHAFKGYMIWDMVHQIMLKAGFAKRG